MGMRKTLSSMLVALLVPALAFGADDVVEAAPPVPESTAVIESRAVGSDVFGASLFQGRFSQQSFKGFNPDYTISVGDRIDLKMWGAFEFAAILQVDSQGNVFVPSVGPITVANTRNADLNQLVRERVKTIYRENVGVYASLANSEPVKVFVTGNVVSPGLYGAYASDSLLHFLDQAGGIDPETGSFLTVQVLRSGTLLRAVNLYDFLLKGELPLIQFQDGDTILIEPQRSTAKVSGLVRNVAQFEFDGTISLRELLAMAGVDQRATHVQLIRNQTAEREVQYLPIEQAAIVDVASGDEVQVFADRQIGTIITKVEGEYQGLSQFTLPYESTLEDLIAQIQTTERSDLAGVQIYRQSIADRQKQVLDQMLDKLEQAVLNARSATVEEAELRAREAEIVLRFVERARQAQPKGQLVLPRGFDPTSIDLQDGDVLRIPRKTRTIAVQGEVMFPSSFVYQPGKSVDYYLEKAGGLIHDGSENRIYVMRPNGELLAAEGGWFARVEVQAGDEIMVMPQVQTKTFQLTKDLIQVLYQLALSAGVVLSI